MNSPYIKVWLAIGRTNPWIRAAVDPVFDEKSFHECKEVHELIEKFRHGNWCLGQAFYLHNICFMNQVNGGDEWLVIRGGIDFESWSCEQVLRKHGEEYFLDRLARMYCASDDQLMNLEYMDATYEGDVNEFFSKKKYLECV